MEDDESVEDGDGYVSRSERKRRAEALQKLGVRLTELRPAQLAALALPPDLVAAIEEARRLRSRAALARQRQYIGRLMRELEPDVAERVLSAVTNPHDAKMPR
jgi:ribosome-associated protein